jgi:hypothetical protein
MEGDNKSLSEVCRKLEKKISDDIAHLEENFTNRCAALPFPCSPVL